MKKEQLQKILDEHARWLKGEGGQRANLEGAYLDYSVISLSCKDLGIHIDDRLAIQRLYHTLYNVAYSKHVSKELKDKLLTNELLEVANRFHRVEECGKIERLVGK